MDNHLNPLAGLMRVVALRTGKSLRKSGAIGPPQPRPDPLSAITILATAPDDHGVGSLGVSDDLSGLESDEEREAVLGTEQGVLSSEHGFIEVRTEAKAGTVLGPISIVGSTDEPEPELVQDAIGRRDLVLFSRSKLLPTIIIKLKSVRNADLKIPLKDQEPLPPDPDRPPVEEKEDQELFGDEELEALRKELAVKKIEALAPTPVKLTGPEVTLPPPSITRSTVPGPVADDAPTYGIAKGAIVLLEGDEAASREVAEAIAHGLLSQGRSVTYVSTFQTLPALVGEMQLRGHNVVGRLGDMQFMVIPVYPLIEGRPVVRDQLLEKLMSSPQLCDNDALVVDAITSFMDQGRSNSDSLKVWPFLRRLSSTDKVIVLTAARDHEVVETLRSAAAVHLVTARDREEGSSALVSKAPLDAPDKCFLLKFQITDRNRFLMV
jgi:archaellum biogenesis ATPase FlaH